MFFFNIIPFAPCFSYIFFNVFHHELSGNHIEVMGLVFVKFDEHIYEVVGFFLTIFFVEKPKIIRSRDATCFYLYGYTQTCFIIHCDDVGCLSIAGSY